MTTIDTVILTVCITVAAGCVTYIAGLIITTSRKQRQHQVVGLERLLEISLMQTNGILAQADESRRLVLGMADRMASKLMALENADAYGILHSHATQTADGSMPEVHLHERNGGRNFGSRPTTAPVAGPHPSPDQVADHIASRVEADKIPKAESPPEDAGMVGYDDPNVDD